MPVAWRLVKAAYADTPLDGEGARRFGGRWSSPGRAAVYASDSLALAALEVLVHLQSSALLEAYLTIGIDYEGRPVLPGPLPEGWRQGSTPAGPRRIGDAWLDSGRSAVLKVPSAVIPREHNVIFNPAHPRFRRVRIVVRERFVFDPRIVSREP